MRISGCVSFGLATLALAGSCFADTTAAQSIGGGTLTSGFARSIGWEFTVSMPMAVSALGVWDYGSDGLSKVHQIGLFRVSDSSLVVSATLIDGSNAALIDGSRFVDVPSTPLVPGTSYYILADDFSTDPFVSGNGSIGFAPEINWLAVADTPVNTIFGTPTFTPGTMGNLGPNFRYAVPTPGAVSILGIGAMLIGMRRRRA